MHTCNFGLHPCICMYTIWPVVQYFSFKCINVPSLLRFCSQCVWSAQSGRSFRSQDRHIARGFRRIPKYTHQHRYKNQQWWPHSKGLWRAETWHRVRAALCGLTVLCSLCCCYASSLLLARATLMRSARTWVNNLFQSVCIRYLPTYQTTFICACICVCKRLAAVTYPICLTKLLCSCF